MGTYNPEATAATLRRVAPWFRGVAATSKNGAAHSIREHCSYLMSIARDLDGVPDEWANIYGGGFPTSADTHVRAARSFLEGFAEASEHPGETKLMISMLREAESYLRTGWPMEHARREKEKAK